MSAAVTAHLDRLAELIVQTAASLPEVGEVQDTVKWGQRSFLPVKPRTGTTIRIAACDDDHVALYVHCQTTLIETFKTLFPEFCYEGNRAMIFAVDQPLPEQELTVCISAALTYHLQKRLQKRLQKQRRA